MKRIPGTCARYIIRDRTLHVFCGGTSNRAEMRKNLRLQRVRRWGYLVNRADLREAYRIAERLPARHNYDAAIGRCFSRGAGVGALVTMMLHGHKRLILHAPKRTGCRGLVRHLAPITEASAYRCDIIPLLPFWYASWRCKWSGWTWPWKAHEKAARDAARWRHEISRG